MAMSMAMSVVPPCLFPTINQISHVSRAPCLFPNKNTVLILKAKLLSSHYGQNRQTTTNSHTQYDSSRHDSREQSSTNILWRRVFFLFSPLAKRKRGKI